MKRKVLVCLGMLASAWAGAGTAQAADMASRRYDDRIQQPAYYPNINWNGFYLGINGGGAWGDSKWTSIGGNFDVSGGMIGATAGYNWQWNSPFVLGLEGDIDWTNIDGSSNAICPIGCKTSNGWLATVRGRIGYAFDRFLPFITGGLAVGDIKASQPGFIGSEDTNAGWTVGGGFEFVIAGRWSAKAEYLYVDLGKFNCGLACGNGFNPDNVSFNTHVVRGGVNFRF